VAGSDTSETLSQQFICSDNDTWRLDAPCGIGIIQRGAFDWDILVEGLDYTVPLMGSHPRTNGGDSVPKLLQPLHFAVR